MLKRFLLARLGQLQWHRAPVQPVSIAGRAEMPRFPIRALLIAFTLLLALGCFLTLFFLGNPVAKVRDPRLARQYNDHPLTSLAAKHGMPDIWLGSEGAGIKVHDAPLHLFRNDITRVSTGNKLLSDFIVDVDFGPKESRLAGVTVSDGRNGPGGVQICTAEYPPVFWPQPIIDLSSFPGLEDTNASCVIASADQKRLVVGTRGLGLGVYHIAGHSWTDRVTRKDGLPSDTVHDLATVPSGGSQGVVWVATDQGLCAGPLNEKGRFEKRWSYTAATGLAGDSVRRLLVTSGHVYYLTEGRGLGRIAIDLTGAPVGELAQEVLVSERRLPGLTDRALRRAVGSQGGRKTWFVAEIGSSNFVGRYAEKPHDTFGKPLSDDFERSSVNCLSTDPESGTALFVGTDKGGWAYLEVTQTNGDFRAKKSPMPGLLPDIAGGFVGPVGTRIREAALAGPLAIIKTKGPNGVSGLQKADLSPVVPWTWSTLVGAGRFAELASIDDVTSVAKMPKRTYIGTKGKGVGVWDRESMELRLEMHATRSEATVKLRDNTSLDLAAAGDTLIQVTGDKAVETFAANSHVVLVPPDEAPLAPGEIVTATARGKIFACAGSGKIGLYDLDKFGWREMAGLDGITRLEVTSGMLWALTESGQLHRTLLSSTDRSWTLVAESVKDLAASQEAVYALVQTENKPAGIYSYSGQDGSETFRLTPEPLESRKTNWRFAAVNGGDLFLVGDDPAVHRYSLRDRQWKRISFPDGVTAPVTKAVRTANAFWLVDSAAALHRFQFEANQEPFQTGLEQQVERLAGCETSVAVLLNGTPGPRLVARSDNNDTRRVLVGRAFAGNLAQVSDAIEWQGKLVAAQGEQLGFYDWATHDWDSVKPASGSVNRFYSAGDTLWALCGGGTGGATLQVWSDNSFNPVQDGANTVVPAKVSAGRNGLFVLDNNGRVLFVAATKPATAEELIAATSLDGGVPAQPALSAVLEDHLVVGNGRGLHSYGPTAGLGKWTSGEFREPITRLVSNPAGSRLVAQSDSKVWVITPDFGGRWSTKELLPGTANGTVTGIAAGTGESACSISVAGETGARVWSMPANGDSRELIGAPLPASPATRAVLASPDARELIRLDAAGTVSVYAPDPHAWTVELSNHPLDAVWLAGNTVFGYGRKEKSLYVRSGATWQADSDSQGKVERAFAFPDGVVAHLSSGELAWRRPNSSMTVSRPPRSAEGPGALGSLVAAAETDGLLAVLDDSGRLAIFDWPKQAWLKFDGGRVHSLVRQGTDVFLLVESGTGRQLAGPMRRGGAGVTAPVIRSPKPIRSVAALRGALFCVAEDRSIYALRDGSLKKWWGGGNEAAAPGSPALLAAERVGTQAFLLAEWTSGQAFLMKVDLTSLGSQTIALPSGHVETVFRTTENDLFALLATPDGKYPLNLLTMQKAAPPSKGLQEVAVVDKAIWGVMPDGVYLAAEKEWRPLQEAPEPRSEEFTNLLRRSRALYRGTVLVTNSATGAWRDGQAAGRRVDVFIGPVDRRLKLVPHGNRLALAHEFVNDIAADEATLFAATDGGVVEFKTDGSAREAEIARIHDAAVGLLKSDIKAIEWLGQIQCTAGDGGRFEFANGVWRTSGAPDATLRLQLGRAASRRHLDNWEFPDNSTQLNVLRRRFRGQDWRTVKLLPGGFDFEQTVAAEVNDSQLLVYTPAGTLIFNQGGAGFEPDDLLPKWHTPPTLGSAGVIRGPGNERFLAPSGELDKTTGGTLLVRDDSQWRSATAPERRAAEDMASGPFIDNAQWRWERPKSGDVETVTWKPPGGSTIRSTFSPQSGRFGWEVCLALGQAQGQAWMLTPAGLFKIAGDRIDLASLFTPQAPLPRVSFLDVSGDMPGALVTDAKEEALCFDDSWKPPEQMVGTRRDLFRQFRATSKTWRIKRDGTFLRRLPQSSDTFAPVQLLSSGRWNFETISDLAALEGACYLASEAGLAETRGASPGLSGLWTEAGKPVAVDVIRQKAVARLGESRNVEFDGAQWRPASYQGPLHSAIETNEGPHFKLARKLPGVTFEARRSAAGPYEPVKALDKGFAFDQVQDAQLKDDSTTVTSTEEGLLELGGGGDLARGLLAGAPVTDKLEFFRVPGEAYASTLYARASAGQFLKCQNGWQSVPPAAGTAALILSQTRLAQNGHWQVNAKAGQGVEVRLHLDDDPTGLYKLAGFEDERGLFSFDDFVAIATPDPEARLVLGTRAGLQRITQEGRLQRLWCQKEIEGRLLDGLGPVPVNRVVRDESGVVQLLAEGQYLQVDKQKETVINSAKNKFDEALALKAAERDGWRVELNRSANIPLRVKWGDEPVFLVPGDNGKARFAHNVVYSALVVDKRLVLGTAGGLVLLDSEREQDRATLKIVVRPFIEGGDRAGSARPVVFGWLGLEPGSRTVLAQPLGGQGPAWRIPLDDLKNTTAASPADLEKAAAEAIAQDDVLIWRHPKAGRIQVRFAPGKSFPENLQPEIAEGTFTFLNLDLAGVDDPPSTLLQTSSGVFWITRAGLAQFNPDASEFHHLYAETASSPQSLKGVTTLLWGLTNRLLYARQAQAVFEFNALDERWTPLKGGTDPFLNKNLANVSSMLEWRQSQNAVRVTLKETDCESQEYFAGGRPALDDVNDFAFGPEGMQNTVLLATRAGVAEFAAQTFDYLRLQAAAFSKDCKEARPVAEIASVKTSDIAWRNCARTEDGGSFELVEGRWQSQTNVEEVFELSYRRVAQPELWNWSRYASGLTCTLLNVNGPAFRLGRAVHQTLPGIFCRGKMAIDDARGVIVNSDELLVLTPVGLTRYALRPEQQEGRYTGLDVWAGAAGANDAVQMTGLLGLLRDNRLVLWNARQVFANPSPGQRVWKVTSLKPEYLAATRRLTDGAESWLVQAEASELSVNYRNGIFKRRWFIPVAAPELRDMGVSDEGLWFLTRNELIQADKGRAGRSLPHLLGVKADWPDDLAAREAGK